jgi:hypothetical protein
MKKLKLSLDALNVESFSAVADGGDRGTVAGYITAIEDTCDTDVTLCDGTCVGCRTNFGPNCPTQKLTGPCGC